MATDPAINELLYGDLCDESSKEAHPEDSEQQPSTSPLCSSSEEGALPSSSDEKCNVEPHLLRLETFMDDLENDDPDIAECLKVGLFERDVFFVNEHCKCNAQHGSSFSRL